MAKSRQAKSHEFPEKQRKAIYERDNMLCIFCQIKYHMVGATAMDLSTKSIMHYISRQKGGLGIEQNGAIGCYWHHHMLDNGNQGNREEMQEYFREYLKGCYKDWNENKLTYDKWAFLKEVQCVFQDERAEKDDKISI